MKLLVFQCVRQQIRVNTHAHIHTHTYTYTQTNYCNPRCTCAPRVKYLKKLKKLKSLNLVPTKYGLSPNCYILRAQIILTLRYTTHTNSLFFTQVLRKSDSDKVTVVGAGVTLHEALKAYETLKAEGINIRVVDAFCLKVSSSEY